MDAPYFPALKEAAPGVSAPEHMLDQRIRAALDIGMRMLVSGAEISRVEDTIERICTALGSIETHVFTVTAGIIVTSFDAEGNSATQLRRTRNAVYDLYRLEQLNQLSRDICSGRTGMTEIRARLQKIDALPVCAFWVQLLAYMLISGSLTVFFGGTVRDAAASAVTGGLLCLSERGLQRLKPDNILLTFLLSFLAGLCNLALVRVGLGENFDAISIGNVMLLIPGISMTNAVHDMFVGDMISGTSRFFQSLVVAFMVAFGFTAAGMLL